MKLIQFGAGNIGRSFIGQLFSRAGWEIVFIDIDERIINELNKRGRYTIEIRDREHQTIEVKNVRGVSGLDIESVRGEICEADLIATAVGQKALPHIMKPLAMGLMKRNQRHPGKPLDIIICENMRDASVFFKDSIRSSLPQDFPLNTSVGFVETSIGKMVPIMSEADREKDPLLVFAEAYNTLILDRNGFKGTVPDVPGLDPKKNIKAYVDRKLFIHNMGHAVLGYTSFVFRNKFQFVWEAADDGEILAVTGKAMWESGNALIKEYPDEFTEQSISDHIEDLLNRFKNKALGDTIYRVGRDLYRKLGPYDRLIGSIKLCLRQVIRPEHIALGTASALLFKAVDEEGNPFENDRVFHEREMSRGIDRVLRRVCSLEDTPIIALIKEYHAQIVQGNRDINDILSR